MPDGTTAPRTGNPWGSTPHLAGALWHERDPGVSSILVAAARQTANAGRTTGQSVRPERPEGRVFNSSPSGEGSSGKKGLADPRRCYPVNAGRITGSAPAQAGGRVFKSPLRLQTKWRSQRSCLTLSPDRYNRANASTDYRGCIAPPTLCMKVHWNGDTRAV